jgi:dienelactone hydrolase
MELVQTPYLARGRMFPGFLADGARRPGAAGILVLHEGAGLNAPIREKTLRLAHELGALAYAPDLFGAGEFELERFKAIVAELRADTATLRARTRAALGVLEAHPSVDPARLAAVGFCFGGTAAIELARSGAPLAAVVGVHAGLTAAPSPADNSAIACPILLCLGADDPVVTQAQRDAFAAEMSEARVDWQIHLYGGVGHSFTNPEIDAWNIAGFRYDARAEARSWAAMRRLFDEKL